jgi:hypothetical protein
MIRAGKRQVHQLQHGAKESLSLAQRYVEEQTECERRLDGGIADRLLHEAGHLPPCHF